MTVETTTPKKQKRYMIFTDPSISRWHKCGVALMMIVCFFAPFMVLLFLLFFWLNDSQTSEQYKRRIKRDLIGAAVGGLIFNVFILNNAKAASFDCSLDTLSRIERTICTNKELSALDEKLNSSYRKVINALSEGNRALVKAVQSTWIELRDLQCVDAPLLDECLLQIYKETNDVFSDTGTSDKNISKIKRISKKVVFNAEDMAISMGHYALEQFDIRDEFLNGTLRLNTYDLDHSMPFKDYLAWFLGVEKLGLLKTSIETGTIDGTQVVQLKYKNGGKPSVALNFINDMGDISAESISMINGDFNSLVAHRAAFNMAPWKMKAEQTPFFW